MDPNAALLSSALLDRKEHNPHHFLGLHLGKQRSFLRLWRPGAKEMHLEVLGKVVEATKIDPHGLFEFQVNQPLSKHDYRVYHSDGSLRHDPYAIEPLVGEMDAYLFNAGCHYELYRILGAHLRVVDRIQGVHFVVWAPNATQINLVADFNHWQSGVNPMRSMGISGLWELFVPGLEGGEKYKFEVVDKKGVSHWKSDPFAFAAEIRPHTASIVADVEAYSWKDREWISNRRSLSEDRPLLIYEVHLGSWKKYGQEFPNYREVAVDLAEYCVKMGFNCVELLPILEHPLDESWGYQVTGFFAATSRFGTPEDFQFFVDHMHQKGIGVLLDWVPAHFPMDAFSLHRFDGTALYEHGDPGQGIHPHWNTAIFNYKRKEVSNFLLASALFWIDQMHVDGLRVDAVASMLYLDYGRKAGEWTPNPDGTAHNLDAIEFLKHLNSIVHERFPGVLMIAEESSSFEGVSRPVAFGGLGFDLKWNMGWMNDTLRYFAKDPVYRRFHQNDLTFSLLYAFSERFLSVLSHDEVVHLKRSLLSKMAGPEWQQFAHLRLLYSYLIAHPGKKLLFMGGEWGQRNEWDCKGELEWHLLEYPLHRSLQRFVREINHFYLACPSLWERDFSWEGFEWIDFSDADQSVISYLRKGGGKSVAIVHHFTPEYREQYRISLKNLRAIKEVMNSDSGSFGGSDKINPHVQFDAEGFTIQLAPLATMIFEVEF
jgi:1,4-alpha-glucan branching enzyme